MMRMQKALFCSLAFVALVAAPLVARDTTFKGTVTKADKTSVEISDAAKKTVAFTITDKTKVTRDGKADTTPLKVGEALTITVAKGDEAKTDFTCGMHPEVSEAAAGRCPKCGMTLKQRSVPAKAATIQVGGK